MLTSHSWIDSAWDKGIDQMIEGLMQIDALKDPIGEVTDLSYRPTGIQIGKMRVPLGVIGMIYESRPNVTVDAAALCLKAGNACILRGGRGILSNQAIAACVIRVSLLLICSSLRAIGYHDR